MSWKWESNSLPMLVSLSRQPSPVGESFHDSPWSDQGMTGTRLLLAAAQQRFQGIAALAGTGCWLLGSRIAIAVPLGEEREGRFENLVLLERQSLQGFWAIANFRILELAEARTGRNQVTQDHVFLQTHEVVDLAG